MATKEAKVERSKTETTVEVKTGPAGVDRAPQRKFGGAQVIPQGGVEPQVGGVHASNLGEHGIVRGQLATPIYDPVAEAQAEAEDRDAQEPDDRTQEEQEAEGRAEIGEAEGASTKTGSRLETSKGESNS